jgi:hypothetical protein
MHITGHHRQFPLVATLEKCLKTNENRHLAVHNQGAAESRCTDVESVLTGDIESVRGG